MGADDGTDLGSLPNGGQVFAASPTKSIELLTTVDEFVQHQSRFDRHARLNLSFDVTDVTLEMYLDYVRSQVTEWTESELDQLKQIVSDLAAMLTGFAFDLPAPVYLVKTTGQEEANAAYTRNRNTIVLPANMVASLWVQADFGDPLHDGGSQSYLRGVVLHECFHLFSKNNVAQRSKLYDIIGYRMTADEIALPEVGWPLAESPSTMPELKITNPDTPRLDVIIDLEIPAADSNGASSVSTVCPVLMASGPYRGGSFFGDLGWYFMEVDERDGVWSARLGDDGRPVMHLVEMGSELLKTYERTIGHNFTGELFHPDEVLAQNWTLVASEPSLELLTQMSALLR